MYRIFPQFTIQHCRLLQKLMICQPCNYLHSSWLSQPLRHSCSIQIHFHMPHYYHTRVSDQKFRSVHTKNLGLSQRTKQTYAFLRTFSPIFRHVFIEGLSTPSIYHLTVPICSLVATTILAIHGNIKILVLLRSHSCLYYTLY